MDVTKNNFEEALPLVEESIRNCDFIAFDAEFSGKSLRLRIPIASLLASIVAFFLFKSLKRKFC